MDLNPPLPAHPQTLQQQFAAYPFDTDVAYQEGLSSILSNPSFASQSDEDKAQLILRSRVFYFNQISGANLSLEDAALAITSAVPNAPSPPTNAAERPPQPDPQVLSFAELKTLIEQGRTGEIPNNEKLPDGLNETTPSESSASLPKKPWERATPASS